MALPSIGTTATRWLTMRARTTTSAPASGSGPSGRALAGGDVRAEVRELQRRAGCHRLLHVDDGGQRVVVDLHEVRGVGGGRRALGDDHGDGLADEPHPVGRQRRPRQLGVAR